MLPKEDRKAMLLRLFGEIIPLQDTSKDRFLKNKDTTMAGATMSHTNGEMKDVVKTGSASLDTNDLQAVMDVTSDEEASVEENTV